MLLEGLGCDLKNPNYRETPERVARMYLELFGEKDHNFEAFVEEYANFILLKGHKMYSVCPHHLVLVKFTVHLAYIPVGRVLGLSKLVRVLNECNSGPLLQEKFTRDAVSLVERICKGTKGVACLIEGEHGCTTARGVRTEGTFFTYHFSGDFKSNHSLEQLFFQLVTKGSK